MRNLLIAAGALALATPAVAQPPAQERRDGVEMPDSRQIGAMAAALDRMVGALLDMPVGPIVAAVDPLGRSPYRRGDRLRDLSDDPHVEHRLRDSIHGTAAGMGAMMEAMSTITPVLRRSLDEARVRMEDAISDRRDRRD